MPVYPGDPQVDLPPDSWWLGIPTHAGTHVDAPAHMLEGAPALDGLSPDVFTGPAAVLDVSESEKAIGPKQLKDLPQGVDHILLRSGWDARWGSDEYFYEHPYLTPEGAKVLADSGLLGVGMDFPSPDPMSVTDAHRILFGAGMILVENLCNLSRLPLTGFIFTCLPLNLEGRDGAPCRAVGLLP